jgi:hypothetical protein
MNIQSNPHRVASQSFTQLPTPGMTTPLSLWLDLPEETQKRIAQSFSRLLLRMRPTGATLAAARHVESNK